MTRDEEVRFIGASFSVLGEIILTDVSEYPDNVKIEDLIIKPEIRVDSENPYVPLKFKEVLNCGEIEELGTGDTRWNVTNIEDIEHEVIPFLESTLLLSGQYIWLEDLKRYIKGEKSEIELKIEILIRQEKLNGNNYEYSDLWYSDKKRVDDYLEKIEKKYERKGVYKDPIRLAAYISTEFIEFKTDPKTGGPKLRGDVPFFGSKLGTKALVLWTDYFLIYDLELHFETKRHLPFIRHHIRYSYRVKVQVGNEKRIKLILALVGGNIIGPVKVDFLTFKWYTEDILKYRFLKRKKYKEPTTDAERIIEKIENRAALYQIKILDLEHKRAEVKRENPKLMDFSGFDHLNKKLHWFK